MSPHQAHQAPPADPQREHAASASPWCKRHGLRAGLRASLRTGLAASVWLANAGSAAASVCAPAPQPQWLQAAT